MIVPALALWLHLAMRQAIGASLVVVAVVSAAALIGHLSAGSVVDWSLAVPFAAATVTGALIGASLSARIGQAALGRSFAALVAAVATYLLASVVFLGGPPSGG